MGDLDLDQCRFFHGRVSREAANQILKSDGIPPDGTFLVRESTRDPGGYYVLSVWVKGQGLHFQFKNHGDAIFSIDDGPTYQGVEAVIQHYRTQADGLPCKLTSFFQGALPPLAIRRRVDTELHLAVQGGKGALSRVQQLIKSGKVIDVNARNPTGATALLLCSHKGSEDVVQALLSSGADPKLKDTNGNTPLKVAANEGHSGVVRALLQHKDCDVQDRAPHTGWVPLHESAMRGHVEVVKLLLQLGAPINPRTPDNDTPRDLALRFQHRAVVEVLDHAMAKHPKPKTKRSDWLHRSLNRQGAIQLLKKGKMCDGLFMVRPSSRTVGYYALSMASRNQDYHYEIRTLGDRWHFIDDGPYFESLEAVVEHHTKRSDGLVDVLRVGICPGTGSEAGERALSALGPGKAAVGGGAARPQPQPEDYNQAKSWTGQVPGAAAKSNGGMVLIERTHLSANPAKCKKLGEGEFGSVLLGRWKKDGRGKGIDVAIKTLRPEHIAHGEPEFLREAQVMMSLNHPCIVRLIGVCLADKDGSPMMLVQELVGMGSLLNYLMKHENDHDNMASILQPMELWASQIANGMLFLEQKKFVHRDLAARNILLSSKTQCKISDFGLSRAVGTNSDYYRASQGGRWPVKWYAPESVNYGTFSHSSDVWSYGITLWEMFSLGAQPYGEMSGAQVMHMLEELGQRLDKPRYCPDHTYGLMRKCWSLDPNDRPTFEQLYEIFLQSPEYENVRNNETFYADPRELVASRR
eukprot:scpid28750/ scgid26277/ Tyrosine-protein kinase HTK16